MSYVKRYVRPDRRPVMIKLVDENFKEDEHKSETQTAWEALTELVNENKIFTELRAKECVGFFAVLESSDGQVMMIGDQTNPHYCVGKLEHYKNVLQMKMMSDRIAESYTE